MMAGKFSLGEVLVSVLHDNFMMSMDDSVEEEEGAPYHGQPVYGR